MDIKWMKDNFGNPLWCDNNIKAIATENFLHQITLNYYNGSATANNLYTNGSLDIYRETQTKSGNNGLNTGESLYNIENLLAWRASISIANSPINYLYGSEQLFYIMGDGSQDNYLSFLWYPGSENDPGCRIYLYVSGQLLATINLTNNYHNDNNPFNRIGNRKMYFNCYRLDKCLIIKFSIPVPGNSYDNYTLNLKLTPNNSNTYYNHLYYTLTDINGDEQIYSRNISISYFDFNKLTRGMLLYGAGS